MTVSAPPPSTDEIRIGRAAEWSARLAEGPLPREAEAAFQAWLDADPANGEAMDEVIGAWRMVESYAAAPEMVALRGAALASARRAHRARWARSAMRERGAWVALAATLVLVLGLGGAWMWTSPRTYETGLGERRLVALPDGSKVSLDGATVVRVRYAGNRRRLWLDRGRAKFEVAKDPLRPFSVQAAGKVVVATGTAFSVELLRREVRVVLYEGRVAVLDETGAKAPFHPVRVGAARLPAERVLTPGHELIAAIVESSPTRPAAATPAVVVAADPTRSLAWEAGQLVFEDEPLSVAVERMNRYATTPLLIGDAAAARVRISGVFRAGDTGAFAEGVSIGFPVRAVAGPDGVTLSSDRTRLSAAG